MRRVAVKPKKDEVVTFSKAIPEAYKGLEVVDKLPPKSTIERWIYFKNKHKHPDVESMVIKNKQLALIKDGPSGRGYGSNCFYSIGYLVNFKSGGSLLLCLNHNENVVIKDKGFNPYILVKILK
jgi:hypothetical protein